MDVLILGTGAIGGFYGGKLSQAGANVSVICRSDYEVVSKKGISVKSVWGDFHFQPTVVWNSAESVEGTHDVVIVGLKVLPEIDIVKLLKPIVHPKTSIVLIQNGIGIESRIQKAFPKNELISGLAFICVSREAPGQVHHQDYGRLVIGNYPSGVSIQTDVLSQVWQESGVDCQTTNTVKRARWEKLVWNAPFNPISVLAGGATTQQMMQNAESLKVIRKVMEEVCLTAKADGCSLNPAVVEKNLDATLEMRPYKPSMLLDYEAGRPMEVEAILGNAIRIARHHQIAVPHMETLYALLQMSDFLNT